MRRLPTLGTLSTSSLLLPQILHVCASAFCSARAATLVLERPLPPLAIRLLLPAECLTVRAAAGECRQAGRIIPRGSLPENPSQPPGCDSHEWAGDHTRGACPLMPAARTASHPPYSCSPSPACGRSRESCSPARWSPSPRRSPPPYGFWSSGTTSSPEGGRPPGRGPRRPGRNHVVAEGAGRPVAVAPAGRAGPGNVACIVSGANIDSRKLVAIVHGAVPA